MVKASDLKLTFAPAPDGTQWLVLLERETRTLYRVDVPHEGLADLHDPNSVTALGAAIKDRALAKLAAGETAVLATTTDLDVTTWEQHGVAGDRALAYHTERYVEDGGDTATDGLVMLDLSGEQAARDAVAALDETARNQLADALNAVNDGGYRASALHHIRQILAQDSPGKPVIGVVFPTWLSANQGYLMDATSGEVLYGDGTTAEGYDFGDDVQDALSALYGTEGETFTVAVDLRTDTFDDSNSETEANVHIRFGHPAPRG